MFPQQLEVKTDLRAACCQKQAGLCDRLIQNSEEETRINGGTGFHPGASSVPVSPGDGDQGPGTGDNEGTTSWFFILPFPFSLEIFLLQFESKTATKNPKRWFQQELHWFF